MGLRHIISIALAVSLILAACGSNSGSAVGDSAAENASQKDIKEVESETSEGIVSTADQQEYIQSEEEDAVSDASRGDGLSAEEDMTGNRGAAAKAGAADQSGSDEAPSEGSDKEKTVIVVGETYTIDDVCEFYIEYANITQKLVPPVPTGYYMTYTADTGNTFFDICISYKNLDTTSIDADETVTATMLYSSRYTYNASMLAEEDNRSDITNAIFADIDPLASEFLHIVFHVPEETGSGEGSVIVYLTIGGEDYELVIFEGSAQDEGDDMLPGSAKTSGEITVDETVNTGNIEFCIESSGIMQKVYPKNPSSGYYRYYSADSGETYVDVCFRLRSLESERVKLDNVLSGKLVYAEKYEYNGFKAMEEKDRTTLSAALYESIDPLVNEYVHYIFTIPDTIADDDEPMYIEFTIDGNKYVHTVR